MNKNEKNSNSSTANITSNKITSSKDKLNFQDFKLELRKTLIASKINNNFY